MEGEANRRGSLILPQSNISTSSKSVISPFLLDQEFNSLVRRFSVYDRQQASNTIGRVNIVTSTPVRPGARTATDKYSFLPCKDHQNTKLCIKTCDKCLLLLEQEKFSQGRLPTTTQ